MDTLPLRHHRKVMVERKALGQADLYISLQLEFESQEN